MRKYFDFGSIKGRGTPFPTVGISRAEYESGVSSGELMHVFDKSDLTVKVIKRDGYYSPEVISKLVNIDKRFRR
jgi:hypothetical protein